MHTAPTQAPLPRRGPMPIATSIPGTAPTGTCPMRRRTTRRAARRSQARTGGGEAGGVAGHDPSIAAIQLPSPPQAAPQTQPGQGTNCRYEFFRGHFCDVAPRR